MANLKDNDPDTEDQSVEDFLKNLKINGRYFVGNQNRIEYITRHKQDLDLYIISLKKSNHKEAILIEELLKLNSKSRPKRALSLEEMSERVGNIRKQEVIRARPIMSIYTAKPRKIIEKLLLPTLLLLSIPISLYIGNKFRDKIEKVITPYVQKIYNLYNEIDRNK